MYSSNYSIIHTTPDLDGGEFFLLKNVLWMHQLNNRSGSILYDRECFRLYANVHELLGFDHASV